MKIECSKVAECGNFIVGNQYEITMVGYLLFHVKDEDGAEWNFSDIGIKEYFKSV